MNDNDDLGPYWVERYVKEMRGEVPAVTFKRKPVPKKSLAHDAACGLRGSHRGGGRGGLHSKRRLDRLLGKVEEE